MAFQSRWSGVFFAIAPMMNFRQGKRRLNSAAFVSTAPAKQAVSTGFTSGAAAWRSLPPQRAEYLRIVGQIGEAECLSRA